MPFIIRINNTPCRYFYRLGKSDRFLTAHSFEGAHFFTDTESDEQLCARVLNILQKRSLDFTLVSVTKDDFLRYGLFKTIR